MKVTLISMAGLGLELEPLVVLSYASFSRASPGNISFDSFTSRVTMILDLLASLGGVLKVVVFTELAKFILRRARMTGGCALI